MAPSTASSITGVLFEGDDPVESLEASLNNDHEQISKPKPAKEYKLKLVWRNIILFVYLHVAALYGAYLALTSAKLLTDIWGRLETNAVNSWKWSIFYESQNFAPGSIGLDFGS